MSKPPTLHPGKQIGRLKLVMKVPSAKPAKWVCRCDCGTEKEISATNLYRNHTLSCGCLRAELGHLSVLKMVKQNTENGQPSTTHGQSRSATYIVWSHMIDRCSNVNCSTYEHYGGRGIAVSDSWKKFENFHADMGDRPAGFTLDRIDNSSGYSKENCRWATKKEQARNTRTNRNITWNGVTKTLAEWSENLGINYKTLSSRFNSGWSTDRAFSTTNDARYN